MIPENLTDFIVTNGPVYTSDPDNEWAEAFAVRNGKIVAVGDEAAIRSLVSGDTPVIEAPGLRMAKGRRPRGPAPERKHAQDC